MSKPKAASGEGMNEEQARQILGAGIEADDELYAPYPDRNFMHWMRDWGQVLLEGVFTANKLEAIAWWMKNKGQMEVKE